MPRARSPVGDRGSHAQHTFPTTVDTLHSALPPIFRRKVESLTVFKGSYSLARNSDESHTAIPDTAPGTQERSVRLHIIEQKADPEQMLLPYLRRKCILLYGWNVERIAKAHGSQCGFCSPGMVMSVYSLLRNHPEPTMEQIYEALGGNLCRCTGYRAILDGCKTLCKEPNCCKLEQNGQPDHDQRDNLMIQNNSPRSLVFQGEKVKWITVFNLEELLDLKVKYPEAPLMVGNTSIGPEIKSKGVFYPVIISIGRIPDLNIVKYTKDGLSIGAACTLSMLKETLEEAVSQLPYEKTKTFRVLLQQLKSLAGQQIRNVAVC
ncbi:unnamed protein product [Ranitomeya imitator]|uniref:FAD-binding PCMH-type domain-containing protein n=1 Tax=Ranitomeya imitator TaxID=111125 RepID=A0ABN9MEU4_9NEOB|nr:unnamed protein product [Ranitomeya imitator]